MKQDSKGNVLLSIGEIVKLCNTTRDTLYFYERKGLIKPAYIDPDTGYRFYDMNNTRILDMIRGLREAESSIDEIQAWSAHPTPVYHVELLQEKLDYLDRKIELLEQLRERVRQSVSLTREGLEAKEGEIRIEQQPEEFLLRCRTLDQNEQSSSMMTFFALLQEDSRQNVPSDFHMSAMISHEALMRGSFDADYFYLTSLSPVRSEYNYRKPAGTYLCTCHYGPYTEIARTYRLLMAEIEARHYRITGDSYEKTLIGWINSHGEENYRTKVSIQIEEA